MFINKIGFLTILLSLVTVMKATFSIDGWLRFKFFPIATGICAENDGTNFKFECIEISPDVYVIDYFEYANFGNCNANLHPTFIEQYADDPTNEPWRIQCGLDGTSFGHVDIKLTEDTANSPASVCDDIVPDFRGEDQIFIEFKIVTDSCVPITDANGVELDYYLECFEDSGTNPGDDSVLTVVDDGGCPDTPNTNTYVEIFNADCTDFYDNMATTAVGSTAGWLGYEISNCEEGHSH